MSEGGVNTAASGRSDGSDDPPRPVTGGRPRFPALDPEPAPPSAWRRLALAGGTMVAAAGLAAGGYGIVQAAASSAQSSSSAGQVVILASDGHLALVTPGQATTKSKSKLGNYFHQVPPFASSDGRYLVASDGTLIALSDKGMSVKRTAVALDPATERPPLGDALADQDQALIALSAATGRVSVIPLATGRAVDLGVADTAAGDPQGLGAFVAVPAAGAQPATSPGAPVPDSRMELRDVGTRPVVLAAAGALNRVLNQPADEPVALGLIPDPAGDRIAITVSPVSGDRGEGIVVVDRKGHVLATVPPGLGAEAGDDVAWSPDASSLAFGVTVPSGGGTGIDVFTLSGQLTGRLDPQTGATPLGCRWSPDGGSVICQVLEEGTQIGWAEANVQGGPVVSLPAPGQLLAWLPPSGSQ